MSIAIPQGWLDFFGGKTHLVAAATEPFRFTARSNKICCCARLRYPLVMARVCPFNFAATLAASYRALNCGTKSLGRFFGRDIGCVPSEVSLEVQTPLVTLRTFPVDLSAQ